MIVLMSDRLKVSICEPGEGRNQTRRFDRAGFINSVILDGKHEFCTQEPDNLVHPCSGGVGLCSEIKDADLWAETSVGGQCPKFGIGLLRKPDEKPYRFFEQYEVEPFHVDWQAEKNRVLFTIEPKPCMGYAVRQKKEIIADGSVLTVRYTFENTGEKPLTLGEYCHNFVTIDHLPLGKEYLLSMPTIAPQDDKKADVDNATVFGKGSAFSFSDYNPSAAIVMIDGGEIAPGQPFSWTITHQNSPASVTEEDSFVPTRIVFWSIDHILSPEVYTHFTIAPGETVRYYRKWIFRD